MGLRVLISQFGAPNLIWGAPEALLTFGKLPVSQM
jgi:hypothetical protein